MKLLYGVQGTGNGHITRARALNKYLAEFGLEVDFLFSGRDRDRYFDMEEFGDKWNTQGFEPLECRALRVESAAFGGCADSSCTARPSNIYNLL